MKQFLIALAFIGIIGSMASAGFFLVRRDDEGKEGENGRGVFFSLALRVGLSVLLFLCILLAWKLGLMQPVGIPTNL